MRTRVLTASAWLALCAVVGGALGHWILGDSWSEGAVRGVVPALAAWAGMEIRTRARRDTRAGTGGRAGPLTPERPPGPGPRKGAHQ